MPTILIVEDDLQIAAMYKFKLEQTGFKVHTASNGLIGLEKAQQLNPHLILLDLRMPELSGDKMLEKLREATWGSNIRVVVLTNISRSEAPSNLQFLGVDRYIVKAHSTPKQVMDVVCEILGEEAVIK